MVNPHQREGLRYSHPHTDTPEEKDTIAELTDKYAPPLEWLKIEAGDNVKNGEYSFYDHMTFWPEVHIRQ
jgi:hypothetical protein